MTKATIILIALALALVLAVAPAAAVKTYDIFMPQQISESSQAVIWNYQGTVVGGNQAGSNFDVQGIGVTNDICPDKTFYYIFPVTQHGEFRIDLIPGDFTLHLINSNGDVAETAHVKIAAGQTSYPDHPFLGHPI